MNIRPKQSRVQKANIQHNHTLLYLVDVCFSSFNPLSFDSNIEEKVQNKLEKKNFFLRSNFSHKKLYFEHRVSFESSITIHII